MRSLILLIICNFCCYYSVTSSSIDEWYWRDYKDIIPRDVLPTGLNAKGEQTFLGQIIVPSDFTPQKYGALPATIRTGEKIAVGSYNGHISNSTHNVKILCTTSPERFIWFLPTDKIPAGCRHVIVGDEKSNYLHAGRIAINNELIIGKVISDSTANSYPGMYYPYEGLEMQTFNYQILFYCENFTPM